MVKTFKACIYIIGCLMLLLFFTKTVNAQELKDSVLYEKFKFYSKAHPSNPLFVHTDKTIYTNNETIWFCGYLLKTEASDLKDHTILSVALMREDDRKVTLHSKYLMQQGLSFGSFTLPDTVAPGNYQFIAYTNVLNGDGDPLALFTQSLTIKSITYQDFNAELALLDTVATNGFVRAKLTVALKELDKKERVSVTYAVNKHQGRSFTLKKGENNFIITIPQSQLNQLKPTLITSVNYKKKTQHLSVRLPEPKSGTIEVRFFPEGGNLAEGLENVVAWETRNSFDQPVAITGTLYRDGRPLDTISTNSYGAGKFKIIPSSKSRYTFKLFANQYAKRDSIYALPTVLENNIVLHLPNAVVGDILRLRLQSKAPRPVQVIVHDFKNIYTSFYTKASSVGKELSLILGPGVPKGITTVTVLDSENRPLAERLFFAHYDQKVKVEIKFDKASYKRKDSVHVSIKLSDHDGKPIKGVISLAAVQDNRIEGTKYQDIESHVYLTQNLGILPQDPIGRGFNNKEYLENMLRLRGWRRYTWQDLISSTSEDTVLNTKAPVIIGSVQYLKKVPKKPVDVIFMRDSSMAFITTDTGGFFELNTENALIIEGRTLFLSVNAQKREHIDDYSLKVENPFITINKHVAEKREISVLGLAVHAQNTRDHELKGMKNAIALSEVMIKGNSENSIYRGNECGDYVCIYNILNCPRHYYAHGNRAPVSGKIYLDGRERAIDGKLPSTVYEGCTGDSNKGTALTAGIYTAREFYGVNMDDDGLLETQFLSTLMWQPGLVVNDGGEIRTSFATSDITGKFRLVVQGIGTQNLIFGENIFTVE